MTCTDISQTTGSGSRRGAAVLLEVLRSEGVRYIFGNPGTTEMPLIDALLAADASAPAYVLGLQEASVVAMAHGYALASGRPGFVNLHTAGGLGHAMGALINAQVAQVPLVVTAGQQDTRHGYTDPLLSGNLVGIASPAVKWAHEVTHPDQIPVLVRRAFHDSAAAPAGPVFLSLPMDVMERTSAADVGAVSRIERRAVAGSLEALGDALAEVRPGKLALFAGDEIFAADAGAETLALAEALGAPVFGSSWPGHLPFPTNHPLWAGSLPSQAAEINARLADFDAIFALGGNSAVTYLFTEGPALPPACQLFQLSASVRELGRTYPVALACVGDLRASLQALLPSLAPKLARHHDTIAKVRGDAVRTRATHDAELSSRVAREFAAPAITPLVAAAEIARAIPPDVAIVDESPVTAALVRQCLRSSSTRQYFGMRAAILGWGVPAAVGVSLGRDRAPVVSLVGDGSSLYSPQALWTAARERLPVTFVVTNNREYNILKNYLRAQTHYLSAGTNRSIGMDLVDPAIDFQALAASLGVSACRVQRAADLAGAVESGIASGRPNLIEVSVGAP